MNAKLAVDHSSLIPLQISVFYNAQIHIIMKLMIILAKNVILLARHVIQNSVKDA